MFGKDIADLQRHRLIGIKPRLHKDQIGALAFGSDRRHRGAYPEFARLVACRCDDATLAGATDCNGLATQFGVVALLDRGVERIHVDMDDLALTCRLNWPAFRLRLNAHRAFIGSGAVREHERQAARPPLSSFSPLATILRAPS